MPCGQARGDGHLRCNIFLCSRMRVEVFSVRMRRQRAHPQMIPSSGLSILFLTDFGRTCAFQMNSTVSTTHGLIPTHATGTTITTFFRSRIFSTKAQVTFIQIKNYIRRLTQGAQSFPTFTIRSIPSIFGVYLDLFLGPL